MNNNNKIKSKLLGMPFGTASGRLRKAILFNLVQKLEEDICFRCGEKIENIDNFSIEHKEAWQKTDNPVESFFDLDNIAFSHLRCNIIAGEKKTPKLPLRGEKHHQSILTVNDVLFIRKKLEQGIPQRNIAEEYGVSQKAISDIHTRRKWGWLK